MDRFSVTAVLVAFSTELDRRYLFGKMQQSSAWDVLSSIAIVR